MPFEIKDWNSSVLHLHWLHSYYWPPFSVKSKLLIYLVAPIALIRLLLFILGLSIYRTFGGKIVWTAHNIKYHEEVYPVLDRICTLSVIKLSHAIIAHGKTAKEEIIADFNITSEEKVFVIPHGNYLEVYENEIEQSQARDSLGLPEADIVFLFFGFIRPYKGVFELIEAFNELDNSNIKLLIAGKPLNEELADQIREQIASNSNIVFKPGFVPDENVQTYMNASDLVVLPYRDILTSGAAVLAMSFGKACIAVRIGSIRDVLSDSGAFLYEADDENGLFSALRSAIDGKDRLSTMGKNNLKQSEQWSWKEVAAKTVEVYQWCVES